MKHTREIKVALLAVVCGFLLYFGMYFLRGVNIFSPTRSYTGVFERVNGLTEQAPVYVRGYNVGQVNRIEYDFTRRKAFNVSITIDKHISLPEGAEMVLVADGLMGGKAIELIIPVTEGRESVSPSSDTLPTRIEQGLVESLQTGLLAHLDSVLLRVDSVVASVEQQLEGDHIGRTLTHLDRITEDLTVSANDIRQLTHQRLPRIADSAAVAIDNANAVLANVREADIAGIAKKADIEYRVSLNPIMVDGTGMCGACRCNVDGKTKFACVDGPEFDGRKVDWEQIMMRRCPYPAR